MSLVSPSPTPITKRPFQFSVIREFLDLDNLKETRDGKEIITLKREYTTPTANLQDGKSPAEVLMRLVDENGGPTECKLVYITRHGQSQHNVDAREIGNVQYSAVCAHFAKDRDPSLTLDGEKEAREAGDLISGTDFARPSAVYCSSLKRTVQTAVLSAARYWPADMPLTLLPRDGLREFMGPGQVHMSDGRGSRQQLDETLAKLRVGKNMVVKFEDSFTREDDGFSTAETYVNVDARIERELNKIFNDTAGDPAGAVHIVSHNRAIQSTMRLLGYSANRENYRVFDFDNGATVLLLIKRTPRTIQHQEELQISDAALQEEEKRQIDEAYYVDINSGFEKIQDDCRMGKQRVWQPWSEQLEAEVNGGEAGKALQWRLEFLKRAMAGQFRYGDFEMTWDDPSRTGSSGNIRRTDGDTE